LRLVGVAFRGSGEYLVRMNVMDDNPGEASSQLCVLASGSMGNCSVLRVTRGGMRRACLIDLGLSPRRTFKMLDELGIGPHQIDDVLLTHLDADHFHQGWTKALPSHVRVRLHKRHARRVDSVFTAAMVSAFESTFHLQCGARVSPVLLSHDEDGVTAMRFEMPEEYGGGVLGFATDLGRVTRELVELFKNNGRGVDVLAIESNYCPRLQAGSGRPEFLVHRITGGRGHLSNAEAIEAIRAVEPREHVVLLHLSRDCNRVDLVASMHEGSDYHVTITSQAERTRWISVRAPRIETQLELMFVPVVTGAVVSAT